jgi:membrane protease subunit HflK
MSDHPHSHAPETRDTGSQALAEALRSSFVIVRIAMVALVVIIFAAGFFTVNPGEKAVILRFGKPLGEGQKMLLSSGKLYWAYPYPIDEVVKIPISEIQRVTSTVGWYLTTPEMEVAGTEPPAGPSLNPVIDGYVITADRNIIHTRATVSYHIDDPRTAIFSFTSGTNHSFNLNGISNAVLNAANNALVATAARFTVDDILNRDRAGFQDAVRARLSALVEQEKLGVVIDQCQIQSVPPRQLKEVFAAVTTARQNRDTMIQTALGEQNRILAQAGATASAITNAAEAARTRFVSSVQSDAEVFTSLLPRYLGNPRLYMHTELAKIAPQILTNAQRVEFLPRRADGQPRELRLLLNDLPPQGRNGQ